MTPNLVNYLHTVYGVFLIPGHHLLRCHPTYPLRPLSHLLSFPFHWRLRSA
jgi:hypothetical protein